VDTSIPHDKHRWRPALASVLAALWLSACGGGSDAAGSASTNAALVSPTASAQAAAQPPAAGQAQAAAPAQTQTPAAPAAQGPAQPAAPAQAAVPSTGEFTVNTTTPGLEAAPAIARLKNGGHVIAWNSERIPSTPGDTSGVHGVCTQRYGADAQALGAETCLAPNVAPINRPVATALADGGYLIVWKEPEGERFGDTNVWAQRFDAAGMLLGSAQQINSATRVDASGAVQAAGLADGGYVVTWASATSQLTPGADIYARRFGADGIACPCGAEKRVNTFTSSSSGQASSYSPLVAALQDGGYVIVWRSLSPDGALAGSYAQRYGAEFHAAPVGPEIRLTSGVLDDATAVVGEVSAIAALPSAGYVLAYPRVSKPDGVNIVSQLVVQPFAADGTALAAASPVDPLVAGAPIRKCNIPRAPPESLCPPIQRGAALAALDDGSFVVAWSSDTAKVLDVRQSYVRRYSAEGAPLGAPALLTAVGVNAALSPTSGGGFVAAFDELDPNRPPDFPKTVRVVARYFDAQAFRDRAAP